MSKITEILEAITPQPSAEPPEHLTLKGILSDIASELRHQGAMGAHELAAGMMGGYDGFVMYPKAEQIDSVEQQPHHGLPVEPMKQPEMDGPSM